MMCGADCACPNCGALDLDPRAIVVGVQGLRNPQEYYHEILTLKCQCCGWLGESENLRRHA